MKFISKYLVFIAAGISLLFLFIPNIVVFIFSFNKPQGRYNYEWNSFSFNAWTNICQPVGLCRSLKYSLVIGISATIIATVLGTMLSLALVRYAFKGSGFINQITFLPLATPDVVLAASLLALFINIAFPLGFWTVLIAHVSFMLSYVVTTVKARLLGGNDNLEQAAMDLYATPTQSFFLITLPQIAPGIAAAAILAFSLSFDDFIVTNFNSGVLQTYPMYVWGQAQRGVPPQVNVVGSIFFVLTLIGIVFYHFWGNSKVKRLELLKRK